MELTEQQIREKLAERAKARGQVLPSQTQGESLVEKYGFAKATTTPSTPTTTPSLRERLGNVASTATDVVKGVGKSFIQPIATGAELLSKGEDYVQNKAIELAGQIKGATPEDVEVYKQDAA